MAMRELLTRLRSRPDTASGGPGENLSLISDTTRPARFGLWVLAVGFGGFLLWAAFAPLDEGVPTPGQVVIDTKSKVVQHLTGGIISEVDAREGKQVKAGDVLIRLDPATAKANYESVRQHYLTLRAMEGRLLAEQAGQSTIAFHQDLLVVRGDPLVQQVLRTQEQLLTSRRQSLQASLQGLDESIRGQDAAIDGYRGMLASRKQQLALLQEQLKGIRDLVTEGYAPRTQQMDLQRNAAEATGQIADLEGNIIKAQRAIAEFKQRAIQAKQDYRKDVDSQLADVRREVQADADKLKAAKDDLARTEIRSPADGQVVDLADVTVGGVVQPGQKLMDIVPANANLVLESKVATHLIDKVHAGLPADVRFSTFAKTPGLVVAGEVMSVSRDAILDPKSNQSYYLARVAVTEQGMTELGHRQLQAGMPAEIVIKTGERSLLTYLLDPLLRRFATAMKE